MESGLYTKQYLLDRICVAMGGRIAEELIQGKDKITTGAQNDFMQATSTAKMMVEQMGMSDTIGPRSLQNLTNSIDGMELKNKADQEIDRILNEQYKRGL